MTLNQPTIKSLAICAMLVIAGGAAIADNADNKSADGAGESIKERVLSNPESANVMQASFYQNCAYCHGAEGSGGKARKLQCREWDPDYLFNTISKGKRRGSLVMPPWEKTFNEEERWQFVAYIQSLKDLPTCTK